MDEPKAVIVLCGKRKCGKDYIAERLARMWVLHLATHCNEMSEVLWMQDREWCVCSEALKTPQATICQSKSVVIVDVVNQGCCLVSPASLLDSQHGCIYITAREEGVWSNSVGSLVLHCQQMWSHCQQRWIKTTPHNNQIHFLVQEIPGQVETKPLTEFDQTPSSRAVM